MSLTAASVAVADRKRPAADVTDSHSSKLAPPSKTAKLADTDGTDAGGNTLAISENDDFEDLVPGTNLLRHQKAAIWAQMQHYRRLAQETDDAAQAVRSELDAIATVFDRFATGVYVAVSNVLATVASPTNNNNNTNLASIVLAGTEANDDNDEENNSILPQDLHDAILNSSLRASVFHVFRLLKLLPTTNLTQDPNATTSSSSSSQDSENGSVRELIAENMRLKSLLDRKSSVIEELQEEASLQTAHRLLIERRLDKFKAAHLLHGGVLPSDDVSGSPAVEEGVNGVAMSVQSSLGKESNSKLANGTAMATSESGASQNVASMTKADESSLQVIADKRLEDLMQSRQRYAELIEEKNKLVLQLDQIKANTSSLLEYPEYKKLEAERNFLFGENGALKDKVTKLSDSLKELNATRQEFKNTLESEHKGQLQKLNSIIDKLNEDLDRIRTKRDELESQNIEYSKKEKIQLASHKATVDIAQSRLHVIESLKKKIERLINDGGKFSSCSELVSFLLREYDDLTLEKINQEVAADKARITSLIAVLEKNGLSEDGSKKENDALEESDLETRISRYEKSFNMFSTEVESISEAYSKLEESSAISVEQLRTLEERIAKLISEKDEISKKLMNQQKLMFTKSQSISNLSKMQDKQLEQVKILIQSEKNLKSQITILEKSMATQQHVYDKYQLELTESSRLLQDYKLKNDILLQESSKVEEIIKESRTLYEEESAQRQLAEEKAAVLQSRLEGLGGGADVSAEVASLKKELDHWKFCLKCSSCSTNFKSHVLLRCMHVFCEQCIEKQMESRQRKCPSCGMQFGRNDIRQIFL